MTFSKPYPGTFAYEGTIPSQAMNYINDNFTHILDKTGDNATNGGGISGRVDVLSGANLQIQSGGVITLNGGTINYSSGTLVFNGSSAIAFNDTSGFTFNGSGNAIFGSSASLLMAGTLNITSGATLGINSGGTMHVKSGATATVDNGGHLAIAGGGEIAVASGGQVNLNAGSFLNLTSQTTVITGSLVEVTGASTVIFNNSGASFLTIGTGNTFNVHGTHKTDVWPSWNSPITRQVIESTTSGIAASGTWGGGLQFVYDTGVGGVWVMQLQRSHNKATLNQIFVGLSVGGSHSAVPANRPSLSLIRYRWDGMFNPQALSTVDPQVFPNPGSGAAYYNSGNQQFMNYVCNQNNVIDNENYIYVLSITDESGANSVANNAFGLVTMEYQVIPDLSWNI